MQSGRITTVGEGHPAQPSKSHIDGRGMTLMPGYIDTHRHLFAYTNARSDRELERYIDRRLPDILTRLLQAGITTVLSPGDHSPEIFEVREALNAGTLTGPRLLAAGRMLHAPGDHPATTLCQHNRYCRARLSSAITKPGAAGDLVQRLLEAGADMIKTVHDRELQQRVVIDDATIAAIAAEASRLEVPLLLHTRESADLVRLTKLGVNRIVHTPLIGSLADINAAGDLQHAGLAVQTTLSWVSPEIDQVRRSKPQTQRFATGLRNVRYLVDSGIPVAFGTDNPPPLGDVSFMPEVRALRQVLSNAEIIRAMTYHAAVFLHLEHSIGSIRPGLIADLVLLDGNPLTDLNALQRVHRVFQGGRAVAPADSGA